MNKDIWHILLVTAIISAYCNTHTAAELPVVSSIESLKKLPDDELFQFSDDVIIDLFDKWSTGDGTVVSKTPLQTVLNGDKVAIHLAYGRINKISPGDQPRLYWKTYQNLRFPPSQATRIIEHLLSTKKASANEKYEGIHNKDTPLHRAQHPEHVALLVKYGADLKAPGRMGHTPLEEAIVLASIDYRDIETIEALLQGGAPIPADRRLYHIIPSSPKTEPLFFNQLIPLLDKYRTSHAEGTNSLSNSEAITCNSLS